MAATGGDRFIIYDYGYSCCKWPQPAKYMTRLPSGGIVFTVALGCRHIITNTVHLSPHHVHHLTAFAFDLLEEVLRLDYCHGTSSGGTSCTTGNSRAASACNEVRGVRRRNRWNRPPLFTFGRYLNLASGGVERVPQRHVPYAHIISISEAVRSGEVTDDDDDGDGCQSTSGDDGERGYARKDKHHYVRLALAGEMNATFVLSAYHWCKVIRYLRGDGRAVCSLSHSVEEEDEELVEKMSECGTKQNGELNVADDDDDDDDDAEDNDEDDEDDEDDYEKSSTPKAGPGYWFNS